MAIIEVCLTFSEKLMLWRNLRPSMTRSSLKFTAGLQGLVERNFYSCGILQISNHFFIFFAVSQEVRTDRSVKMEDRAALGSSVDRLSVSGDEESDASDGEAADSADGIAPEPPCDILMLERLIRTHPIWYLPGIQRSGAVHLLQGKEDGVSHPHKTTKKNLIVRSNPMVVVNVWESNSCGGKFLFVFSRVKSIMNVLSDYGIHLV